MSYTISGFRTRRDAQTVINEIMDIYDTYACVSVADVHDIVNRVKDITVPSHPNPLDHQVGWSRTNPLKDICVVVHEPFTTLIVFGICASTREYSVVIDNDPKPLAYYRRVDVHDLYKEINKLLLTWDEKDATVLRKVRVKLDRLIKLVDPDNYTKLGTLGDIVKDVAKENRHERNHRKY